MYKFSPNIKYYQIIMKKTIQEELRQGVNRNAQMDGL